jgi:hypothetical protein
VADRTYQIPEIVRPGMRNGRHVRHDPQSLRYLAAPAGAAVVPQSVTWDRHSPTLDQGQLGSCVANTGTEILSCNPFWSTLPTDLQRTLSDPRTAEAWAVDLYRDVTRADPFPGAWEPDDTGSDGLSLAKVLKARGLIAGYTHATSLAAFLAAMARGPVAVGTVWLSGMNTPTREGIIRATGTVDGGHEWTCRQVDVDRELAWIDNHWTADWGVGGRGAISFTDLEKLLAQDGDVTALVPITQPAPQPTPAPAPVEAPEFPLDKVRPWLEDPHRYSRATRAADAIADWLEQTS